MPSSEADILRPERVEELSREIGSALSGDIASLRAINRNTRLLSLNARIEAARAGNAGAAFAVVAGEVMELAKHMDGSFQKMETTTAPLLGELERLGGRLAREVRGRRLADLAATHLDLVDRNLYERSCDVRWWATEGALVQALETNDPALANHASNRMGTILDSYTVYFDLVLCDMDGKVVANGRPGQYGSKGMSVSHENWFQQALATNSGAEYGFQGVHSTPLVGGNRVLVYSAAVRQGGQERGAAIGVLGVIFRWEALGQTIVENAAIPVDEAPKTAVLIVEREGQILAKASGSDVETRLDLVEWLARDASARFHFLTARDNKPYLVAMARSQGYETYATGWISLIIQNLS
jgi:hypothetical protein